MKCMCNTQEGHQCNRTAITWTQMERETPADSVAFPHKKAIALCTIHKKTYERNGRVSIRAIAGGLGKFKYGITYGKGRR